MLPERPERIKEAQTQKTYKIIAYVDRIAYDWWDWVECHDCKVKEWQLHVIWCDNELCPMCRWQVICCDCLYEWDSD